MVAWGLGEGQGKGITKGAQGTFGGDGDFHYLGCGDGCTNVYMC